ncbi:hypothetical protein ACNKHO_04005 [Shigella flexneri]
MPCPRRAICCLFDRNNHKSNHHGALLQAGRPPGIWKRRGTRTGLSAD